MSKLEERMKEFNIPAIPFLPQGKKVVVYRIPAKTTSVGGIEIPEEHRVPEFRGVLVAAGLKARDIMRDALMEVGDLIWLPRLTTYSPEIATVPGKDGAHKRVHVELLNIDDIVGSIDGQERLATEYRVAYDVDDGIHFYEKRDEDNTRTRRKKAA